MVQDLELETPLGDHRRYKHIVFPNQLEVFLVQDELAKKASATLNVGVGYFSDDDDMPGLAHSLQYMLGKHCSGMYPDEDHFLKHLTKYSGNCEAYTSRITTSYQFEHLSTGDLRGSLDRFVQSFIDPQFSPEHLDRGLIVIDSKHITNKRRELFRFAQVKKSKCNPEHPYSRFGRGTYKSLKLDPEARGTNVHQRLFSFLKQNYSANRMKLAVIGNQSLDILEEWTRDFAKIPNRNLSDRSWPADTPLRSEDLLMITYIESISSFSEIHIDITFPDEANDFQCRCGEYIGQLISERGPDSLLMNVKHLGVTAVSAYLQKMYSGSRNILEVVFQVTEYGIAHFETVKIIFDRYLNLLRNSDAQRRIFDQMKCLAERRFHREGIRSDQITAKVSARMQTQIPREWLLSGYRPRRFDPKSISRGLACFRSDNFKITILSRTFPGQYLRHEEWYGTAYFQEKLPAHFLALPELQLPHENILLSQLKLDDGGTSISIPAIEPELVRDDSVARVWYKKGLPLSIQNKRGAYLVVYLKTPVAHATAINFVMTRLYTLLVNDTINESCHNARQVGLQLGITTRRAGVTIQMDGEGELFEELLERILVAMKDLEGKQYFELVKEKLLKSLNIHNNTKPLSLAFSFMKQLDSKTWYTEEELRVALQDVTAASFAQFYPKLLEAMHVDVLAGGEIGQEQVLALAKCVEKTFQATQLLETGVTLCTESIKIPPGSNFTYSARLRDTDAEHNCKLYSLYTGDRYDSATRAKTFLLQQIAESAALHQLETKEQLGKVRTLAHQNGTGMSFVLSIESPMAPKYLEERTELFHADFAQTLASISDEDFEVHKRSTAEARLTRLKPEIVFQEYFRVFAPIKSGHFNFALAQAVASHIDLLTKADLLDFHQNFIHPSSPNRSKVAVHLEARRPTTTYAEVLPSTTVAKRSTFITDIVDFKSGMEVRAAPQPIEDTKELKDWSLV